MQTSLFPRSWTTVAAQAVLFACAGFLLMACGGGGGTAAAALSPATVPARRTFTVSGEITFAANTAIDSDVNDPAAPYASNDLIDPATGLIDLDLVQRVSRLVTVGGYVNQPGQGADGRSFDTGDVSDFFVADLTAGQTITLNTAESWQQHRSFSLHRPGFRSTRCVVDERDRCGRSYPGQFPRDIFYRGSRRERRLQLHAEHHRRHGGSSGRLVCRRERFRTR